MTSSNPSTFTTPTASRTKTDQTPSGDCATSITEPGGVSSASPHQPVFEASFVPSNARARACSRVSGTAARCDSIRSHRCTRRYLRPERLEGIFLSSNIQLIEEIFFDEGVDLPVPNGSKHAS